MAEEEQDTLRTLLAPKFSERLASHIHSINLTPLSRLPTERLSQTALPHISLIELVSSQTFETSYNALYLANFHGGERERSELIISRLKDDFAGKRVGLAPYRVLGIRDHAGNAAAAAQFSVLFLRDGGEGYAVPYLQYIYVRNDMRQKDISEILQTLILAVSISDASSYSSSPKVVPFTLFETEPPVHGASSYARSKASERTKIHSKSGSLAMLLKRKLDGKVLSAHVQPGLEVGEPPLTYTWALRANPAVELVLRDEAMGKAVVAAYYQSLRDEGFPEENISLAERLVEGRCRGGVEFCLMPLSEVTREMYVDIDVDIERIEGRENGV